MTRALTAFMLLVAVAAQAEEWVIRPPQIGPDFEDKSRLQVAWGVHGTLAAWEIGTYSRGSQAAVVDAAARKTTMPFPSSALFASDGQDYLVPRTWNWSATTIIRGDTGERIPIDDPWWHEVVPEALAWNGRAYVMAFSRHGYDSVILLNARGERISGELALGPNVDVKVACSGNACAVVGTSFFPRRRPAAGLIAEADFPPSGQSVRLLLPAFEPALRIIRLAGNDGGFAVLRAGDDHQLVYERLTAGDEQESGEGERRRFRFAPVARPLALANSPVPLGPARGQFSLTLDGETAYAGNGGRLLKIEGARVDTIELGENAAEVAVALPAGGPVAFYISSADRQVRAFPLTGDSGPAARLRLSNEYVTLSNLRIASGGGVHLAVWEERGSAMFSMLAADGRPLTAPALLSAPGEPGYARGRLFAASSGSTFLVVWTNGPGDVQGTLLALDGSVVKGPFRVATGHRTTVNSLVWHDGRYHLAVNGSMVSLTAGGDVLDEEPVGTHWGGSLYLASNGTTLFGLWEELGDVICTCAPTVDYEIFEIDADLEEGRTLSRYGSRNFSGGPVFVGGDGHRLLLWADWSGRFAVGSDGQGLYDYGRSGHYASLEGAWTSREFLIAEGARLAYHAPGGRLLRIEPLPDGTRETTVSGDAAGGIVLMVREGPDRIIASRRP